MRSDARHSHPRSYLALSGIVLVWITAGHLPFAAFQGCANDEATFTAAADWTAPTISRAVIRKFSPYVASMVKQGGTYYAYAQVTDTGNPASGISTVRANLTNLGDSSLALMSSGSFTVEGLTYNYRSTLQTPSNPLSEGTKTFTNTAFDAAGNSTTTSAQNVTVDNTAPAGSTSFFSILNNGATAGKPDAGDFITLPSTEALDPESIISGWNGTDTQNVVVRIDNDASCASASNDRLTVYNSGNSAQLNLGCINLGRTDYVTGNVTFGASGTASTMTWEDAGGIGGFEYITLGTVSNAGLTSTAASTGTMVLAPSSSAYDGAGNAMSTSTVTEGGSADTEF